MGSLGSQLLVLGVGGLVVLICSIFLAVFYCRLEGNQTSKPSMDCHSLLREMFKWEKSYWNSWVRNSD